MEHVLCEVTLSANETTNKTAVLINRAGDTKINAVTLVGKCVVAGGGGVCDAYVQTVIDGTWYDIADFHFTTDASLTKFFNLTTATVVSAAAGTLPTSPITNDTAVNTVLGDSLRVRLITSGTAYSGASTLKVVAIVR